MKIKLIAVGSIKEKYFTAAIDEYKKRLQGYLDFEIIEVTEERPRKNQSAKDIEQILAKEGKAILAKLQPSDFFIPLCIEGKNISSEELSRLMVDKKIGGVSSFAFCIGSSHGLSKEVIDRADFKLSFGKMTYPHRLMRVILAEQLYRAVSIEKGSSYHK